MLNESVLLNSFGAARDIHRNSKVRHILFVETQNAPVLSLGMFKLMIETIDSRRDAEALRLKDLEWG